MKITVLGSGLMGVTTAYALAKRGFEVTVLDRQPESAAECSFANGGQLSYNYAEPWATPELLPKLPKWLVHPDSPLVFRPRLDWQMMRWAMIFLRNCTRKRADINTANILRLGLYSRIKLQEIVEETGVEFGHTKSGILHLFGDMPSLEQAKKQMDFQAKFGSEERIMSADECLAHEPSLRHTQHRFVGGIHAYGDECGDAYIFCKQLAQFTTEKLGVTFQYGINITGLSRENNTITAVETDQGAITSDGFVMALGCFSTPLLRSVNINLPIYPMKGYSVSVPAVEDCPRFSVTDMSRKIVFTRVGDKLRVAGTAEFAGYGMNINEKRITPIVKASREMFPHLDWDQPLEKWACLRPSTPDGLPILGATPYKNLFLNSGHGTLGWTQAAGSAVIVADIMTGKTPEIMLHGYLMDRWT